MRTHPVDKLLEQHCYKSAAGLLQVTTCAYKLQLVRFYVCGSGKSVELMLLCMILNLLFSNVSQECVSLAKFEH
jgi:hypothetical protein